MIRTPYRQQIHPGLMTSGLPEPEDFAALFSILDRSLSVPEARALLEAVREPNAVQQMFIDEYAYGYL
jgi:hypothetical protein